MDCLFDFNKARMNEKSHHLTDVSATPGDKQGRAGGRKEEGGRGKEEKKEGVFFFFFFFSSATPFQVHRTVPGSQQANKPPKNPITSVSVSSFHSRNAAFSSDLTPVLDGCWDRDVSPVGM